MEIAGDSVKLRFTIKHKKSASTKPSNLVRNRFVTSSTRAFDES